MEDGVGRQGSLIAAGLTMVYVASALEISLTMWATGTAESQAKQMLLTRFFSA
jgi:hypothetical protein